MHLSSTMKGKSLLLLLAAAATTCRGFQAPLSSTTIPRIHHTQPNKQFSKPTTTTHLNAATAAYEGFDYKIQWYPVIWAQDLPLNQPTRVTLFDVNYVIAKTQPDGDGQETESFVAMLDECPHKKVALSEGRVTECSGYIQCSYHGWTFDGTDGRCVEIPQTVIASSSSKKVGQINDDDSSTHQQTEGVSAATTALETKRKREDGTAVAITEVQGMIWISPYLSPLEALAATSEGRLSPPPRVPEVDMEEYKTSRAVRDFPIDWTVLMENIMDPDHGYFAHSSSGSTPIGFDWYSSDGVENIMDLKEETSENGGWKVVSSVNAVAKLDKYQREVRSLVHDDSSKKKTKKVKEDSPPKIATTTYVAPSLIYMGRRDNSTATSNFLTTFYVSPVGTGKSRFLSAAVSKAPFATPRWITHIMLNNFLDQDTFLLLGQNRAVLKKEAEGHIENESANVKNNDNGVNNVRKSTYVYRSPSEKLPVKLGQFFDATLSRVPNRKESLLAWYSRNNKDNKLFEEWPSRETVLDRYEQHTKNCPDSQDLVSRCERVMERTKIYGFALLLLKLVMKPEVATASAVGLAEVQSFTMSIGSIVSTLSGLVTSIARSLVQTKPFVGILAALFASHNIAAKIKREFFFKFSDKIHHEDIKFIANRWSDL